MRVLYYAYYPYNQYKMSNFFKTGLEFASGQEQVNVLEVAKQAIQAGRISPDVFRNGDEEDKSLRQAVEAASQDSYIRYADLNVSADEIEALFGSEIRLRFDAKEIKAAA